MLRYAFTILLLVNQYCYRPDRNLYFFIMQISDFGLAVTSGNQSKGNIKLSGTMGYVAPEYLLDGMPFFPSMCLACNVICRQIFNHNYGVLL